MTDDLQEIPPTQNDRIMAALAHVTAVLPMMGIIAPIIIWGTQKDKSEYVAFQALQAIAYQLSIAMTWFAGIALYICYVFSSIVIIQLDRSSEPFPIFHTLQTIVFGAIMIGGISLVIYGFVGAVMVLKGKDFRYIIIGERLESHPQPKRVVQTARLLSLCFAICSVVCLADILNPLLPSPESIWSPEWSPDGNSIAFRCLFISPNSLLPYLESTDDILYFRAGSGDICIVDPRGENMRRLSTGGKTSLPAWTSGGDRVTWIAQDKLYEWDINSSYLKLTEIPGLRKQFGQLELEWSNDDTLAFIQGNGAYIDLKRQSLIIPAGKEALENSFNFTWSRDGTFLAYVQYLQGMTNSPTFFIQKAGKTILILSMHEYNFSNVEIFSWSAKTYILAWIGYRVWGEGDVLFLYQPQSEELLTYPLNKDWRIEDLAWSPNGNQIALQDAMGIHILTILPNEIVFTDSKISVITFEIGYVDNWWDSSGISWSADGKQIAVGIGHGIWILDIMRNTIRPLLPNTNVTLQGNSNSASVYRIEP